MTATTDSPAVPVTLGPKGRVVLPAAVRRAAHIPDGATVIAHADGLGRILIETTDAIRTRVWAAAPSPTGSFDAAADLRAAREQDNRIADVNAARRAAGTHDSAEVGAALLERLGL